MARKVSELEAARAAGESYYFTGKPCKNGHIAKRSVANRTCVECAKLSPANGPARASARCAKWREKNPEKKRENWRNWKRQNPEKHSAMVKRYDDKNKYRIPLIRREWREKNLDKVKEYSRRWANENKASLAARQARRRVTILRATVGWSSKSAIAAVYREAARISNETGIPHDVDHVIPLSSKVVCGLHVESNLQIIPASKNRRKSNKFYVG